MRPKQKRIRFRQAVDPRTDQMLLSVQAGYLKHLTIAFLAEVETFEAKRHLDLEHGLSLREEVRRFEIDLIKYALQRTSGIQRRAAALLGLSATTLNAKIKLYQLQTKPLSGAVAKKSGSSDVSASSTAFDSLAEDPSPTVHTTPNWSE